MVNEFATPARPKEVNRLSRIYGDGATHRVFDLVMLTASEPADFMNAVKGAQPVAHQLNLER